MFLFNTFISFLQRCKNIYDLFSYRRRIPWIVEQVRSKEKIKVLFVLSDTSLWKSEELYITMMNHPRFEPILGLTLLTCDFPSEAIRKFNKLKHYLNNRQYPFIEIDKNTLSSLKPDITFYQQPYPNFISETIFYPQIIRNNGLICDIHYSFRTLAIKKKNKWIVDLPLFRYTWQLYLENDTNLDYARISLIRGKNMLVTGIPFQDVLLKPKDKFTDPWKRQEKRKKRIIYAPHHTIPSEKNWLHLSSFLKVCDNILDIAIEFSDRVQFAFKPHPFLKKKLIHLWGEEKTNKYYAQWENIENCQLVEDSYLELFKHSDALIHDCDSFTIEYCYMNKPVMFLIDPEHIEDRFKDLNKFGQKAYSLHTPGITKRDIHSFVLSIVEEKDAMKHERLDFYHTCLLPPHGNSAVTNIINSILNENKTIPINTRM